MWRVVSPDQSLGKESVRSRRVFWKALLTRDSLELRRLHSKMGPKSRYIWKRSNVFGRCAECAGGAPWTRSRLRPPLSSSLDLAVFLLNFENETLDAFKATSFLETTFDAFFAHETHVDTVRGTLTQRRRCRSRPRSATSPCGLRPYGRSITRGGIIREHTKISLSLSLSARALLERKKDTLKKKKEKTNSGEAGGARRRAVTRRRRRRRSRSAPGPDRLRFFLSRFGEKKEHLSFRERSKRPFLRLSSRRSFRTRSRKKAAKIVDALLKGLGGPEARQSPASR